MFPGEIITKETCEALTRQLGEFQDMCTALPLLTPVIITSIPDAEEQEVLKTIAVQCENRKQVLREEIVSILINLQQNMKWKDTFRQGQQQVAFSLS
jgi:hypothetical protein